MPSDSALESKTLAESTQIVEFEHPSQSLQDVDRLDKRDDEIEVDGSEVKVSAENIEDRSSIRAEISQGSELLEKVATSSEKLQVVEQLESKGVSVEEIGDRSSGQGEIDEGSAFVDKNVTFIEGHQSESLQDVEKLGGEVEVREVRSEAEIREEIVVESDIGHETVDGQRGSADVGVASIEVVQVGVVEIHSGAEVVEKDVPSLEKSEGTVNDEISHNLLESGDQEQVEGAVVETAVGQEDTGEGMSLEVNQTSEPQVMDHDRDHKDSISHNENIREEVSVALESVAVDDSVKLQEADVVKESNPVDAVEEEQMNELGDGSMMQSDQEVSVSHASLVGTNQNICESELNDETAHNSLDGQALASEISDQGQAKVGAEFSAGQEDIGEDKSLEINQASELEVVGSEAEMGDGSVMNHGCDHKDSTSKEPSGGGDQKRNDAGNATMDFISVDGSSKLPEDDVEKVSNADDPVEEAKLQLAESVNKDVSVFSNDQEEATVSHVSSIDIDQNICDERKGEAQVMCTESEMSEGILVDDKVHEAFVLQVVQVGVVEIHSGAKVVEKDVSCLVKSEGMVNDEISHNSLESGDQEQVEGAVVGTAVGQEDTGECISLEVSQASEPQVMDHDCDHKNSIAHNENIREEVSVVLESLAVDDCVKLQEADVVKESNPVDAVEEEQMNELGDESMMQSVQEASVSHASSVDTYQNICESELRDETAHNSLDGQALAAEISDQGQEKVGAESSVGQEVIGEDKSLEIDQASELEVVGSEAEMCDGSVMNHGCDHKDYTSKETSGGGDQKGNDAGNATLDFISVDGRAKLPEDDVEKVSNADDPVEEAKLLLAESVNKDASVFSNDQEEATVSHVSSMDIDQNICDEHKEGEAQVMCTESEMSEGILVGDKVHEALVLQVVQGGVVEIHSGAEVVEKDVSCLVKSEGMVNDEISHNSLESGDQEQVEGAVVETAVGQEDTGEGISLEVSQASEPQVMDHDCDHKDSISHNENIREEVSVASESVAVDDSVKLQEADVVKESNPVDAVEEDQMNELGDGSMMQSNQEASVLHASSVGTYQNILESELSDETAHNSLYGQALAAEISDQGQEKVGAESSAGQEDIGEDKSLEINQASELEVVGSEAETGDGSVMNHGCDHKDSTSKEISCGGDQKINDAENATLDFISVDGSTKVPEADVEKVSNADDSVEDAKLQLAESVNKDATVVCNDQEAATVSHVSSTDVDQNICDEHKEGEGQLMCTESEMSEGILVDDKVHDAFVLQVVQVGVVEIHSGAEDVEKDVSCLVKSEGMVNDEISHNSLESGDQEQVEGAVVETAVGQEDTGEGISLEVSQASEPQVMDHDCDHKDSISLNENIREEVSVALESVAVDDSVKLQEADVVKESNPVYAVEEEQMNELGDGSMMQSNQEASVSHASSVGTYQNICESELSDDTAHNSLDGQALAAEISDQGREKVGAESFAGQEDIGEDKSLEINQASELEVVGCEAETGDGSVMNHGCDHKDSTSKEISCGGGQKINDAENATLDFISVDGSTKLPEADVEKVSNADDSVEEAKLQLAESVNKDASVVCNNQEEATVSHVSSMDIDQNICDEHKEGEAQVMCTESEMSEGILVDDTVHEAFVLQVVQVGVVEIHSGSEVVEKDVSCLVKCEGTVNDEISHNSLESCDQEQVEGAVVETAVGQEDTGEGIFLEVSQASEPQVMDHDCDHKDSISHNENIREEVSVALESVAVDDSIKLQEADVVKESNPVDAVEEEQMNELGDGSMMQSDQVASVSHASSVDTDKNICESELSDETAHNSLDGQGLAAEISDQDQEKVGAESSAVQEDIGEDKSLEISQASELEVVGSEAEMGDGSVMKLGCDHKDSTSKETSCGGDQKINDAENATLDFISVDGSTKVPEADVEKVSNADDSVEEAKLQCAESVNKDASVYCNDQEEATVSHVSSMDIDQNICDEHKEGEAQVMCTESEMNEGILVDDKVHEAFVLQVVQVGVVEIHSGAEVVEKDVSCLVKSKGTVNDEISHNLLESGNQEQVEGAVVETDVGQEDTGEGISLEVSQASEPQVMDHDCGHKDSVSHNENIREEVSVALESVAVDDSVKLQEADVVKESNPVDAVEEEQMNELGDGSMMQGDQEASASHASSVSTVQNICESELSDEIAHNSLDGQALAAEISDQCQDKVVAESSADQEDIGEDKSLEINQASELEVLGSQAETGDGSVMNHGCDCKDSTSKEISCAGDQKINDSENATLDFISVDGSTKVPEADVEKVSNADDSVEEAKLQCAESVNKDASVFCNDQEEATVSHVSSMDIDQNICDEHKDGEAQVVQVGVVEIHSGAEVVEKDVSCLVKSEGMVSDEISHNSLESGDQEQVEGAVVETAVGQEDTGEGISLEVSQASEPQVMDHDCDHKDSISHNENIRDEVSVALESVAVDDCVKLQEADVVKESNPVDAVEEEQMNELGDGSLMQSDQEASVSYASSVGTDQNICECELSNETAHNLLGGQALAAEISDQGQEKVGAESSAGQEDIGGDKSLEINQASELEVVGSEAEMGDGSVMNHGCDHEDSTSKEISCGGDQKINDAEYATLDFISVDSSTKVPEADVEKVSNADDSVEEAKLQCAESVNMDASVFCNDQEAATVSHASSVDIDQNICDEHKEGEAQVMCTESETNEGILVDDKVHEAFVLQVSVVDDHQNIREEGSCSLESAPVDDINCHQVRGSAEMGMDVVIDGNRGRQSEAYVLEMLLTNTEQEVQEESYSILDPVPVDSIAHQEDRVEKGSNPNVRVVEEHSESMDEQTQAEDAIESLVDDDHQGNDPEASVPETSVENTKQSFQEKGESLLEPGLVDSVSNQADSVVENPNLTEPAVETEVGDGSVMDGSEGKDHKASVSEMFLMETSQKLRENQDFPLVPVPIDNTMNERAGHVEALNLADPVIESQPQIVLNQAVADHVDASNLVDPVVDLQPQVMLNEAVAGHVDAPNLADPVGELQPQVVLNEADMGDESLLHADKETDSDTSVSQAPFVDRQETGNEAFASKTSLDVDVQNIHEHNVIEAPNLADHILETPPLSDQVLEAPNLADHVIDVPPLLDQVRETPNLADHVVETPTLVDQVIEAPYLADAVLEPQPQISPNEAVVGDESLLDVDKETDYNTSVSHTSFMENQETNNESSSAKSSLVDNNQNIPKENDAILGSILVDCTTDHRSDNVGEFSIAADTVVDKQPRLSGRETEVGDNSMRNVDQDKDREASDFQMSLVGTNENIQQEENSALDLVILNGTLNHEADTFTEGLNPINPVEEQSLAIGAETKLGDGSIVDLDQDRNHEGSRTKMSLVDHTISHPGDHIDIDLNPANVVVEFIEEADEKQDILGSVDVGDVTVDGSTDGEQKAQGGEEKSLKKTKKKVIQSVAAICDQHVSYHLPLDKANFSFSDLVWGKVKSHPWWPGQIFDPSDASKLAMKYQKKDSFLVAYYGDKTFAWCDESQLKPFHSYFSQMEKLCSSDTFVKAICDILMEVSRRIDLGMACSCLPQEDYTDIKHQKIDNAGIRGGIINSIIDKPTVANYFQPDKLLEYIETLAQFPNGKVDRLEFLIAQSQLKAFYRFKGYRELPEFTVNGGLIESVAEDSPSSGTKEDIVEHHAQTPPKGGVSSINRREHGSKDDGKRKNISKLSKDRIAVHIVNGGESKSVAKAAEKSVLSSSGKKHVVVESDPVDSGRCKKRMLDSFGDMEVKSPAPTITSSFKIGEFIRRAASQLTGAPPILKCQGEMLKKHDVADFDVLTGSPVENQKTNLSFTEDYNSTDEMLSQLCLAAKDPMNEYNFVSPIVAFFTGFRDFCVSSFSEDKEHVEKRKRGRPRKVISQQASSDISLSEDEKNVEKRKRGMQMKNVISQLASSDVSSEDEKPVEKRKRGRPRKNPNPASSDSSEDKKPIQKLQRDIPNKVNSQLAPNEKRKRGRPRKVHPGSVLSNTSKPDHVKDLYWSDVDLPTEKNNKNQILKQYKRRKSTGQQSLSHPKTSLFYIEQQLQLVAMNSNMKHTFVAERSIVSVDEKIVDECMPTALILSFNNANSLPSETDLIRIFSRYGPLKEAETDILRKTNRAKVVFKRRVDAETAFSSAGKYSIFGPGLLSYQLKPWTPKSIFQATPQGTQDVALFATPQENCGAEPVATPQGNQDAAFIAAPQDMHESVPITTALDDHDIAPITMAEDNHDASSIITHDKCDAEPTVGSNLKLSEQDEAVLATDPMEVETEGMESSPQGKHDAKLTNTPQKHQDEEPVILPLDEHDLAPNITQDNANPASSITLQDRCDEDPTEGSNVELSEAVILSDTIEVETEGKESSPQEKYDPSLIATPQENQDETPVASPQKNHDAASLVTLQEKCNEGDTVGSGLEISEQAEDTMEIGAVGKESSPDDKHDQGNQDVELVTSPLDQHNLTPTITVDNLDAASIINLQENCDEGPTVGRNLEISEQAEAVIVSGMMEIEDEDRESSPEDEHDQDKKGEELVTPHLDEHDIISTTSQGNLDPAPIITLREKCDAGPTVRTNFDLSEQKKALEVKAEGKGLSSQNKHNLENVDKELAISMIDEQDLTPAAAHDNLEASPINMPRDTHDAEFTEGSDLEVSEQAKTGMASETMQIEAEEQGEPGMASDAMQVEGKESE